MKRLMPFVVISLIPYFASAENCNCVNDALKHECRDYCSESRDNPPLINGCDYANTEFRNLPTNCQISYCKQFRSLEPGGVLNPHCQKILTGVHDSYTDEFGDSVDSSGTWIPGPSFEYLTCRYEVGVQRESYGHCVTTAIHANPFLSVEFIDPPALERLRIPFSAPYDPKAANAHLQACNAYLSAMRELTKACKLYLRSLVGD